MPYLQVNDARSALARLASVFYERPCGKLSMVGITGTNGKTTVAFVVRAILEAHGRATGLLSTVRYEVGRRMIAAQRTTPEAPVIESMLSQMVRENCSAAVMEVSSHALALKRTEALKFDAAVFTNLSRDHLDFHEDMDQYFETKASLFSQMKSADSTRVVNLDDSRGRSLVASLPNPGEVITYAVDHAAAHVRAEALVLGPDGSRFRAETPWGSVDVSSPLLGRFNVGNVLAAIAVCGDMGVPLEVMSGAIRSLLPVPGRLERVKTEHGFNVYVDYAHTDDALSRVLQTLRELTPGRIILVFGCGGDRDRSKRAPMGKAASSCADHVFITSDNPRSEDPKAIVEDILLGFDNRVPHAVLTDRSEAIKAAVQEAQPGDTVLIAGKGHETFQQLKHTTAPFDDRSIVRLHLGLAGNTGTPRE